MTVLPPPVKDCAVRRHVGGHVLREPVEGGQVPQVEHLDPGLVGEPGGVRVGQPHLRGGGAGQQEAPLLAVNVAAVLQHLRGGEGEGGGGRGGEGCEEGQIIAGLSLESCSARGLLVICARAPGLSLSPHLDGEQQAEHELVALEEGAADVDVQGVREVGVEVQAALCDVGRLGSLRNTPAAEGLGCRVRVKP